MKLIKKIIQLIRNIIATTLMLCIIITLIPTTLIVLLWSVLEINGVAKEGLIKILQTIK